ncbi:Metallo-dependent phosphatase-like protein [Chaetomium strumarium]|uniref:Metallo-dependent phosphatase-like protein n=1 Tax=Chaetomium strumarium TaxID=1170767 RepID=A0AAJ0GVW8_9PEZI|nr:Metallo-dependent phosphatase-like protein [Chaetomium strumarium]
MSVKIGTISGPFVGSAQRQSTAVRAARWLSRFQQDSQQLDAVASEAAESLHPGPVTVVCLSDTHNTNPTSVPDGDILLHAGDLSQYGNFAELQAQLAWLQSQPHPHKVVIAGNHDLILDTAFVAAHPDRELDLAGRRRSDLDRGDVLYLEYEAVDLEIKGKDRSVRISGSPWTPRFGSFAFQYGDGEATWTNAVPDGTDILLTHGPPKGYLDDGGKGCPSLLAELWRSRPKLVAVRSRGQDRPNEAMEGDDPTDEEGHESVDEESKNEDLWFPSWPPPNPRQILADREAYRRRLGYRRYLAPERVFEDSPLFVLYRLYEWIMAHHYINIRNELETFWWTRWLVSSIPDPGEQGDPERYAVLACIPGLIVESFNQRIDHGLRRKEPSAILSLEEQLYWASTPQKYEKEPAWTEEVPPLPDMLHIPHSQPHTEQLASLDDPDADPHFKKKNILAIRPHIHFI